MIDGHTRISSPRSNSTRRYLLIATMILFFGFTLRLFRLGSHPLSGDEAFSILNWTQSSLDYLFNTIAVIDPQPPAALLTFYAWIRLVGSSELAARFLSVLASTITLAVTYRIGNQLGDRRVALIGLALCAINPYQIWYAQDARSYSLWMAASALSAWLMLRTLSKPTQTGRWLAYIAATAIATYTFYLEVFSLIAQNLYALSHLRKQKRLILYWGTSQAVIIALLGLWLTRPMLRNSGYQPTGGSANIPQAIGVLLFGDTLPPSLSHPLLHLASNTFSITSLLSILLVVAGLVVIWIRKSHRAATFLSVYDAVPPILLAALTMITHRGYFRPRYISASSVPLILTISFLIAAPRHSKVTKSLIKKVMPGIIAALVLILSSLGYWRYRFSPAYSKAPDWPQIMQMLNEMTAEHDLIIRNYPDPAFDYYYQRYYGSGADHVTLPASPNATPATVGQALHALANQYSYLWLMPLPSTWDPDQLVAKWLHNNTQLISDQMGATHLIQFASWEVKPEQIVHPTTIQFADLTVLKGYRVTPDKLSWQPGETIFLELFWHPLAQSPQSMTVFVHVLGPPKPDGSPPLWTQDDHPPQYGRTTTDTWTLSNLLRDVYTLPIPSDAPAGKYTITVGFYNPQDGTRLVIDTNIAQGEANGAILFTFAIP